jgi:hypothetical protein
VYPITARTGDGKTAVAQRRTGHVCIGRKLAGLDVVRGPVVYLAGENYVDVQMRWLATCQDMGIDPNTADVHFVTERRFLGEIGEHIKAAGIEPALIIIDTSAAYSPAQDENDNVQQGAHARQISACSRGNSETVGDRVIVSVTGSNGATGKTQGVVTWNTQLQSGR